MKKWISILFVLATAVTAFAQIPEITVKNDKIGVNTEIPTKQFHIEGYPFVNTTVFYSKVNYVGGSDVRAVEGHSITDTGYGIGGYFTGGYRGISAVGSGQNYDGTFPVYGVYATATGTAGIRIGLHAQASGGTTNLAAEFGPGDVQVDEDISVDGDVRIGTAADPYNGTYRLIVDGKIIAEEVRVQNSTAWPDYVFSPKYDLMPLYELEQEIKRNQHLPNIPSANIIDEEGIALGDMQVRIMEKIEELTLYTIQQQKEIDALKAEIEILTNGK